MECGATIEEIIDISPNEALAVLKDYTVAKVGSFQLDVRFQFIGVTMIEFDLGRGRASCF